MIRIAPTQIFTLDPTQNSNVLRQDQMKEYALNHHSFAIQPTQLDQIKIKISYDSRVEQPDFIRVYFFKHLSWMHSEIVELRKSIGFTEFVARDTEGFWGHRPFIADKIAFVQEPNFLQFAFHFKVEVFRIEQPFLHFITGSTYNK